MAIDIKLTQNTTTKQFDVSFENGDFKLVDSFDTSLTVSLFADSRASSSQVPRSELRRGWWGNQFSQYYPLFEVGSLLWLVYQGRKTQATLNNAIDFARNSLQWLVNDNHAKRVNATGVFTDDGITLAIVIDRGNSIVETRYYDLWNNSGQV